MWPHKTLTRKSPPVEKIGRKINAATTTNELKAIYEEVKSLKHLDKDTLEGLKVWLWLEALSIRVSKLENKE